MRRDRRYLSFASRSAAAFALATGTIAPGLIAPGALGAQLAPPNATLAEEFTRIASVRELSDGRVLIADQAEKRIVVADLRSGAVRAVGRVGRGPGEFEEPGRFFALAADSSIMQDQANTRRWMLFAGYSIVSVLPPDHPAILATRGSLQGADTRGYTLAQRSEPPRRDAAAAGGAQRLGSRLLRVDRATGRLDTIANINGLTLESRATTTGGNTTINTWQVVFSVPDQGVLFPDGWIAIARSDPYRVDWHPPQGSPVMGPAIPWTPVRTTQEEKQFWHDATLEDAGSDRAYDFSGMPFAEFISPFRNAAVRPLPDGTLLVFRERSRAAPGNDYDIIDRSGRRLRSLHLPRNERIVGFGASSVFVVVRDDDGIERLRRHPWPAGRP
jgi:hypothetical protein